MIKQMKNKSKNESHTDNNNINKVILRLNAIQVNLYLF